MTHRSLALPIAVCLAAAALAGCEPKPKEPKAAATTAAPAVLAQLGTATLQAR